MRLLLGMIHLTRYYWHQRLDVIGKQRVVAQMVIDRRVVGLSQNVLQHLFFGERDPTRFLGFQNVLLASILLRRFPLLLSRLISVDGSSDIILHLL